MISAIAAMAKNRVIGKNNKLPWDIPDDLEFFKSKTKGHPIIMGRKTFESLGNKPLPHRTNIVLSRTQEVLRSSAIWVNDVTEALEQAKKSPGSDEIFIIGGSEIYSLFLPKTQRIYLTLIEEEFEGDSYFPTFSNKEFKLTGERFVSKPLPHKFLIFDRIALA